MLQYKYNHVHLVSNDPLKAAEFYEQAFNAKREAVRQAPGGGTSVALSLEGTRILIRPVIDDSQSADDNPRQRRGLEHFGLRVDDIDAAVADLKAKGIKLEPASPQSKSVYLMAPDNVMVEVSPQQ